MNHCDGGNAKQRLQRLKGLLHFACIAVALGTVGCVGQLAQTDLPAPVFDSREYTILSGRDTLGIELVTHCARRIIGNLQSRVPEAHIVYDVALGQNGVPTQILLAIWGPGSSSASPTQIARHFAFGDSVFTEVWRGSESQIQTSPVAAGSFPYLAGYAGLLGQLIAVLGHSAAPGTKLPLFYVGTGGHAGSATLLRRTADSVIAMVDSQELAAGWSTRNGFQGAVVPKVAFRTLRSSVATSPTASRLCGKPSFIRFEKGRPPVLTMHSIPPTVAVVSLRRG